MHFFFFFHDERPHSVARGIRAWYFTGEFQRAYFFFSPPPVRAHAVIEIIAVMERGYLA